MTTIVCACGSVCLEAMDPPMMTVICHCNSCRTAGRGFDARSPGAHQSFGGPLETRKHGDDILLVLPPGAFSEYGVPSGGPLIRTGDQASSTVWSHPAEAVGAWRSPEWPAQLRRLGDGGLPVTEWR